MESIPDVVRDKIGGKLSLELARFGVQFSFSDEIDESRYAILIESVPLDDFLTGFNFRQRILFIVRAILCIQVIRTELLREISNAELKPSKEAS